MIGRSYLVAIIIIWGLYGSTKAATDIEKALLAGNWQNVYDNIERSDGLKEPAKELLYESACLALDLDCASSAMMFSLHKARSLDDAEEWVRQLYEENPTNSIPAYLLGTIYAAEGKYDEQLSYLSQAIELDSTNVMAYIQRSLYHSINQDFTLALSDTEEAIKYNPGHSKPYTNRGAAHDALGEYEKALADYATAISIRPQSHENFYNRGNTYRHMGDNESAIREFTKAITLDSTKAGAYFNRGNARCDQGEFDEALSDYRRFVSIAPEGMTVLKPVAKSQIGALSRLIKTYPHDVPERVLQWGIFMFEQGDYKTAEGLFTKTLALDSTRSDAYYFRAAICTQTGNTQGALDDFDRAIFYKPNDTTAIYNRARIQADLGQHAEAIAGYTSAISLNNEYALAYLGRAESYEESGQLNLAIVDYEEFIRNCPENQREHCEGVTELLRVLKSDSQFEGLEEAKTAVETALAAWANMDWTNFATGVVQEDLKQFKKLCLPFSQKLGKRESSLFVLDSIVYSWANMKNWTPIQFFVIHSRLLAGDGSAYRDYFDISFMEVIDVIPRAGNRILFRSRIAIGRDEGRQKVTLEVYAVRDNDEWKIEIPSVFMNVAQELNAASKR